MFLEYWREGGAASPVSCNGMEEECVRRSSCVIDASSDDEVEILEPGEEWEVESIRDNYSECGVVIDSSEDEDGSEPGSLQSVDISSTDSEQGESDDEPVFLSSGCVSSPPRITEKAFTEDGENEKASPRVADIKSMGGGQDDSHSSPIVSGSGLEASAPIHLTEKAFTEDGEDRPASPRVGDIKSVGGGQNDSHSSPVASGSGLETSAPIRNYPPTLRLTACTARGGRGWG